MGTDFSCAVEVHAEARASAARALFEAVKAWRRASNRRTDHAPFVTAHVCQQRQDAVRRARHQ